MRGGEPARQGILRDAAVVEWLAAECIAVILEAVSNRRGRDGLGARACHAAAELGSGWTQRNTAATFDPRSKTARRRASRITCVARTSRRGACARCSDDDPRRLRIEFGQGSTPGRDG